MSAFIPPNLREDDEPEPDYDRPTRRELEAEADDHDRRWASDRCPTCNGPFAGPVRSDNCPVPEQHRNPPPPAWGKVDLAASTDRQLAARLRAAADRVAPKRADLAALLNEAAERISGEPF